MLRCRSSARYQRPSGVVPRLHGAALTTTAAAVRVNALVALGKVAPGLGRAVRVETGRDPW